MLLTFTSPAANFPAITQEGLYQLDTGVLPTQRLTSAVLSPPEPSQSYFQPSFGSTTKFAGDPVLTKPTALTVHVPLSGAFADASTQPEKMTTMGGLPALDYAYSPVNSLQEVIYEIPFSSAINPNGFVYLTLGIYGVVRPDLSLTEGYFSSGIPTATALPAAGTATYSGVSQASIVAAGSGDPGDAVSVINASVDFTAGTVAFSATGSTSVSDNAPSGTALTPDNALNFAGTLTYAPASNTFSGTVTSTNGMTGNVTGRFYGAGVLTATSTKVANSPPEVGGTFALFAPGIGSMVGAFGAK